MRTSAPANPHFEEINTIEICHSTGPVGPKAITTSRIQVMPGGTDEKTISSSSNVDNSAGLNYCNSSPGIC